MNKNNKNYTELWMGISFLLAFVWWSSTLDRFKASPLNKHGHDTVIYKDTMYIIRFKIDTAIYIDPNPDNEPTADPRY
jgi:hypothetical protein